MAVAVATGADGAAAHGPCLCLDPRVAEAGGPVRIVRHRAYRVVFNPRPRDLGIAPRYLAGAHRVDVPTVTVLRRPAAEPVQGARFRVPQGTPPGLYLVLIFDGEEGGAHNTWDELHVVDADGPAPAGVVGAGSVRRSASPPADAGGPGWAVVLAAVAGGLAAGLLAGAHRRPG